jgi:aspartyl-tRNA(Asn)/glutamyl-tRNA(Gln) amidotransferase subunit A
MTELTKLTIKQAQEGLRKKEFTSVELTEAFIKKMEENRHLNAYITETPELALERAKDSDEKFLSNSHRKLEGIPMAVKDLFCTKGVRTTAASRILENYIPPYESTVTQKLSDAGYVMLGKTNMDEFAMGSTNTTSYFGSVINPFKKKNDNRNLVPGGSSGGSSAALAGEMCMAATGSDTGGSVRQPAAFTNLVGIKPTYGRASRFGMIPFASSFDQAGIIAKTIRDTALLTEVICGYDHKDSTSLKVQLPEFEKHLNSNIKGKKVGIIKEYESLDKINKEVYAQYELGKKILKERGAEIIEISMPNLKYTPVLYTVIAYSEASSNLSRYDGVRYGFRTKEKVESLDELYSKTRGEGFGAVVKKRVLVGWNILSSENYEKYFVQAQKVRRIICEDFQKVFKKVDVIFTPTTPNEPFSINLTKEEIDADIASNYLNDLFAIPVNIAGLPAISVPMNLTSNGLPTGMQFIGNRLDEQSILNFGLALEEEVK